MNAVGIDVSKRKSTVTIRQPGDIVLMAPRDFSHTKSSIDELIATIKGLPGETKVCMECTGRYHEPMATWLTDGGLCVYTVNPKLVKDFGDESLHAPKTDKADSKKIARFALDRWSKLRQYSRMDEKRNQLKTMNRQFSFYTDLKTSMKNNLIALLDQTFPGVNGFFDSPARNDGHQKWVDFSDTYWHVDCVRGKSLSAFIEHYQRWCKRKGYNFNADKAETIYRAAADLIAVFPKDDVTRQLIQQAVSTLNAVSQTVEGLRMKMNEIASQLPEYDIVMAMDGIGPTFGPQLIAEIGDPTRFTHREALTAFAGVDPGAKQSGDYDRKSNRTSKRGSPYLRKTLFCVMDGILKRAPLDNPVFAFMDKKRSQGKPYLVYMTAGANKFLRIYYGTVRDYLREKGLWPEPESKEINPD